MNWIAKLFTPTLKNQVSRELFVASRRLLEVEGALENTLAQKMALTRRIKRLQKLEKAL